MTKNYELDLVKITAAKSIINHEKVVVVGTRKIKKALIICGYNNDEECWDIEALSPTNRKLWYTERVQDAILAVLDAIDELTNPELLGKY